MMPSCVSCGYVSCRQDGWTMFQHTLHSISWHWDWDGSSDWLITGWSADDVSASLTDDEVSPLLHRTQTAAVGNIGYTHTQLPAVHGPHRTLKVAFHDFPAPVCTLQSACVFQNHLSPFFMSLLDCLIWWISTNRNRICSYSSDSRQWQCMQRPKTCIWV